MNNFQTHTELLEEIKANRAKMMACPQHRFDVGPPPYAFGARFRCLNCGGIIDGVHLQWYCEGWKAAGKDANEIVPGWS